MNFWAPVLLVVVTQACEGLREYLKDRRGSDELRKIKERLDALEKKKG